MMNIIRFIVAILFILLSVAIAILPIFLALYVSVWFVILLPMCLCIAMFVVAFFGIRILDTLFA
jgi:hypothetical protein